MSLPHRNLPDPALTLVPVQVEAPPALGDALPRVGHPATEESRAIDPREASALSLTERRFRDEAERLVRMQQVRLGAARQARIAAERAAIEQAAALALAEAEQLAQAEAALVTAAEALQQARGEVERLTRIEGECRARADAQRSRAVQARLAARALSLRHAAVNAAPGMEPASPASASPDGPWRPPADPAGLQETGGFAPTLLEVPDAPAGTAGTASAAPILTVVPLDRPAWGEAANRPRMGTVLVEGQRLTPVDVEVVLMHQAAQQRRFGEIAVSLGLLEVADVVWALRRQRPDGTGSGRDGPAAEALVMRDRPDSPAAAVIRRIASQLGERLDARDSRQALSIVSAAIGDGKTTVAANLALAMAERGRRVLLIDTDLIRSRMAALLPGLERSRGLSGVLSGRQRLADAIAPMPMPASAGPAGSTLPHVLPAGENLGDPAQLAALPTFSQLLEKVVAHYDQVLLDTPAAAHGSGALRLACLTGSALVVARPGHTRTADLDALTRSLGQAGATVVGVVMNSH